MIPSYCYRCSSEWGWRNSAPVRSGLRVVVQPTGEQVTLAEAKLHDRDDNDLGGSPPAGIEDSEYLEWIIEAREYLENELGRALVPQTIELTMGGWLPSPYWMPTGPVLLPMSPISSIVSVTYLDAAGVPTPFTGYTLGNWSDFEPSWLYLVPGSTWPTLQSAPNAVTIRYTAGYTLPNASPNDRPLPKVIKSAMRLYIHDKWAHRGDQTDEKLEPVTLGIDALVRKYKLDLGIA